MTFDWVSARFACSVPTMFLELKEAVDSNVTAMAGKSRAAFELRTERPDKFMVTKKWDAGGIQQGEAIVFELLPDRSIVVKDARTSKVAFTATVQLHDDQVCRFRVGDRDFELWQVSRLALERLFFQD